MESEAREVRDANERFYRALNDLDLDAMDRLWSHGSLVRCVHPGWELIVGWNAVRASWEGIFRNTRAHAVEAADVSVHIVGELGWVSCIERITLVPRSGAMAGGGGTSLAVATNLFQKAREQGEGGEPRPEWRMILHHASLLPVSVPGLLDSPEMVH
ncbi:MAG: YybH family protein [Vicinamibacteria bacterium]